jgi:hypothetical protein
MKATMKLDSYMLQLVDHQRRAYVAKFGRDPRFDDPVFFDPDADGPRPLTHGKFVDMMIEAMEQAGVEAGVIYAFRKTGLIVTDALLAELDDEDLRDWQQALQEFHSLELHRMAS